jgi:hypothetical protein
MSDLTHIVDNCTKDIKSPLELSEAQYTENFLDIADEIAKLQSITGEKPDYELIVEKSKQLLSEEAKHIKPICYLIFALYQLEKEQGLSAGLEILASSLEQLGDDIYPNKKKKRARAASFEWLRKQLLEEIGSKDISTTPQEQLVKIAEFSKKIKDWMLDYCEDQAVSFFSTFKVYQYALEEKQIKQAAKEKEVAQKLKEEAEKKEAKKVAKEDEKKSKEKDTEQEALDELFDLPSIDDISFEDDDNEPAESLNPENIYPLFLRHLQATHLPFDIDNLQAEVFELHRSLLWGESILSLPNPISRIEESIYPIAEYHTALKLYQEGQFEAALTTFESLFFSTPFHFDIQYYQTQCLLKLADNPHSRKIIIAIRNKLKALLTRNIDLIEQQYPDGPQCASPHVLRWILNDVLTVNASQPNQLLDELIQNDIQGRSPIEQITERYRATHSYREKLSLQLNLALNLKEDGQDNVALNILEQAYKKLTSKALVFELVPQLATQVCIQLWECYNAIEDEKTNDQLLRQKQVFSTISKYCPDKFNQSDTLDIDDET